MRAVTTTGPKSLPTSITVTAPTTATAGTAVNLTATVTPSAFNGTVTFYVNGTSVGTATASSGSVSKSYTFSSSGSFSITASIAAQGAYLASSSNTLTTTVSLVSTSITVTGPSTGTIGTSATLTATVSPSGATGTMTFYVDGSSVGTAAVSSGSASLSGVNLGASGSHTITAQLTGSGIYANSALSAGFTCTVSAPAIGTSMYGGYYAGTIDTTQGNIDSADQNQTGKRYLLIVGLKSSEFDSSTVAFASSAVSYPPTGSLTRWDGLGATIAWNNSGVCGPGYPTQYCSSLSYPADGGSAWYMPAYDELNLIFWNLKPYTSSNYTTTQSSPGFPTGNQAPANNLSSSPQETAATSSVPAQTTVAAFKSSSGSDYMNVTYPYLTSTACGASGISASEVWVQEFDGGNIVAGERSQRSITITGASNLTLVRPVRRVYF